MAESLRHTPEAPSGGSMGDTSQETAAEDSCTIDLEDTDSDVPQDADRLLSQSISPTERTQKSYDNGGFERTESPKSKPKTKHCHRRPGSADFKNSCLTSNFDVKLVRRSASAQNLFPSNNAMTLPSNSLQKELGHGEGNAEKSTISENAPILPENIFLPYQSTLSPCSICFAEDHVMEMSCCSTPACITCLKSHISNQLWEGTLAIECPSCDIILPDKVIIECLDTSTERTFHLLKKMRRPDRQKDKAHIVEIYDDEEEDEEDIEGNSDIISRDTDVKVWAEEENRQTGLSNARKCPDCEIYIQKKAGCFNMKCPICGTKFCYKCGMRLPHDIAIYHKSTTVTVHRPLFTCHRCGNCCLKFTSCFLDCFSASRCLQISRLLISLILLFIAGGVLIKMVYFSSS